MSDSSISVRIVSKDKMKTNHAFERLDNGSYQLRSFDSYNIITKTSVGIFNSEIRNLYDLAYLMPVQLQNSAGKYKHGDITSIRYSQGKRFTPVIRGRYGGVFPHCFIGEIWLDGHHRYISVKIFKGKIQMCGLKTIEMQLVTAKLFLSKIRDAVRFVRELQSQPKLSQRAVDWMCENYADKEVETLQLSEDSDEEIEVYVKKRDFTLDYNKIVEIPSHFAEIVSGLIDRCKVDVETVEEFRVRVSYLMKIEDVADFDVDCIDVKKAMVNYNYSIPNEITRYRLTEELRKVGYAASFMNSIKPQIKFALKSREDEDGTIRRDNKAGKQTFFFYKGGIGMHSGPGGKAMEDRYYEVFTDIIRIFENNRQGK